MTEDQIAEIAEALGRLMAQGKGPHPRPHEICLRVGLMMTPTGQEPKRVLADVVSSDEVVAAAMIDRLVHHAEDLTLASDSFRTRARRELLTKNRDKWTNPT